MPSEAEHHDLARRNRGRLSDLLVVAPEWAAVVAFYVAVHELERLAAADGVHNKTHKQQASYLGRHADHRVMHSPYTRLRSASEVVRYEPDTDCRRELPDAAAVQRLIDTSLAAVERYVAGRLPDPPAAP